MQQTEPRKGYRPEADDRTHSWGIIVDPLPKKVQTDGIRGARGAAVPETIHIEDGTFKWCQECGCLSRTDAVVTTTATSVCVTVSTVYRMPGDRSQVWSEKCPPCPNPR